MAYEIVPQLNDKNSGDVLDALDKLSAAQAHAIRDAHMGLLSLTFWA